MSDRARCCQCSRRETWNRVDRNPWLHVMDPDGSSYTYCGMCAPAALDEWAPEAITAAKHGHEVFFTILFYRGEQLISRRLEFEFERIAPLEWIDA